MAGTRKYGVGVTVATSAVGGLQGVSFSGRSAEVIDVTQHRTGADALKNYREKLAGLIDSGQCTVTANYIKNDVGQEAARDGIGTEVAVVVTFSDASTATFSGIVSEASAPSPDDIEGEMIFAFTIDITGKITFAET
jgi:predicted secreted protein